MDKYIYFAAEMPTLIWGDAPPVSIEDYLEEARKWMTPADYSILAKSLLHHYERASERNIYCDYQEFEYSLRRELANYRKAASEGHDYKFSGLPPQIVREGNPLETEINLMKYRWQWIEDHEFEHYSDLDFFVLYYLKLQILRRLSLFEKDAGAKAFREIVSNIAENHETHEESS